MPSRHSPTMILNLENLSIHRGDTVIVDSLNWKIQPGEHWVIFGPNGSGKTSLLSSLTGYMPPTDGTVSVLGETYGETDWRELRKRIGVVSSTLRQFMENSEPALDTVVSGKYAMIDYWGRPSKADRARARQWLKAVECAHLEDRPWLYLSQGERQRILIARALMARPTLLILDEACAGLDPLARGNFLGFLSRLIGRKDAPALVFVTHHVEEIIPGMTHCLLLKAGRKLLAGPIRTTLTSRHLSRLFERPTRLRRVRGHYTLSVSPVSGIAV
ncbi:ABC transporter ATP-binding protein [Kamptonema cortianum]|nr:ABC transporter ATP-binding protein [Oscillatoria laete-virens]MDK3159951.1 ABC transporter ATP-binding protein [Kamptonema cortianum]MDL5047173.1 ABC transporter ATP-binding protein [Oscillatoria amoena NRMC-F 0135]MDL5055494.1 ABC transporter ATP-binding protein [Oscillatoria laete-virens NRMC-F 0139]